MIFRSGRPSEMAAAYKAAFIDFVASAGEVNRETLPGLVENAGMLVLLLEHDKLIGTAAIKAPYPAHRRGEFAKAAILSEAENYPVELGWIAVHPDFRRRGAAGNLIREASARAADTGIYATTKTPRMRTILEENGFQTLGEPYPSLLDPDANLTLHGKRGSSI